MLFLGHTRLVSHALQEQPLLFPEAQPKAPKQQLGIVLSFVFLLYCNLPGVFVVHRAAARNT